MIHEKPLAIILLTILTIVLLGSKSVKEKPNKPDDIIKKTMVGAFDALEKATMWIALDSSNNEILIEQTIEKGKYYVDGRYKHTYQSDSSIYKVTIAVGILSMPIADFKRQERSIIDIENSGESWMNIQGHTLIV